MKNHELIEKVGGIKKAREIVAGAPDGSVGFGGEDGDCDYFRGNEYFDSDYGLWMEVYFEMPLINKIDDLRTAIAENDAPEFKVGDLVVKKDGEECRILKIWRVKYCEHDPRLSTADYDAIGLAGWCRFPLLRHATPPEIKAGHRELLGNSEQLDDVADIKYHVSPLMKVSCHHQRINQDYLGCTEHHYFCAYCSEKKTESFGVNNESE